MARAEAEPGADARRRRSGVRWLLVGNAATAVAQLGVVVALAHRLSAGAVGDYVLAVSIWGPVVMAAAMGLRAVLASDAEGEHPFGRYLRVRGSALGLAFASTMAVGAGWFGNEALLILGLVGVAKVAESVSDLCYGLQQRHAAERIAGVSLLVRSVLSLGLALGLLSSTGQLAPTCAGMAAANLVVMVGWDLPRARRLADASGGKAPSHGRPVLRLVKVGAPLGLTAVLLSLTTNVPRYFVEAELGREALGVFGVLGYGVAAGALAMNALCHATTRDLGVAWARRELDRFRSVLRGFVALTLGWAALTVGLAVVLGRIVLELVFGPSYAAASDVFIWLMVAGGFAYLGFAFQYTLTAVRSTASQVLGVTLEISVSIVACAWLIPVHGLMGAAYAMLAGTIARAVILGGSVAQVIRKGNRSS